MMAGIGSYLLAFLLLLGGNRQGGDLLDSISVETYWQLKSVTPDVAMLTRNAQPDEVRDISEFVKDLQSEDFAVREKARAELDALGPSIVPQLETAAKSADPEVSATARGMIQKYQERGQERAIRRLMAIRTLGERKEKSAVTLLQGMQDSKDLFVADYARRSLAQIKGEPVKAPDLAKTMEGDVAMLPADTSLVIQTTGISPVPLTISNLINKMADMQLAEEQASLNRGGPLPADMPAPRRADTKAMIKQASTQLLALLERVGNIRIDGATMGLNMPTANTGWYAVTVRGKYNASLVLAALKSAAGDELTIEHAGDSLWPFAGIPVIHPEPDVAILFPNNEEIIFLATEGGSDANLPKFLAALKTGRGGIGDNKEMAAMLKDVDRTSPFWATGKLSEFMRVEFLQNILSLKLETRATKEGVEFTIKGVSETEELATASATKLDLLIKTGLQELDKEAQLQPFIKPAIDFLESMKIKAEAKTATLTGTLNVDLLDLFLGEIGPLITSELIPNVRGNPGRVIDPGAGVDIDTQP